MQDLPFLYSTQYKDEFVKTPWAPIQNSVVVMIVVEAEKEVGCSYFSDVHPF